VKKREISQKNVKITRNKKAKRIPQRADGIESKNKLKKAAIGLLSKNSFSNVSISQITKHAGLSTAAFYQYYINKDELFREIVDDFIKDIKHSLKGESITDVALKYFEYCKRNKNLIQAIHLNEYHFEWLRNEFEDVIQSISEKHGLTDVGLFYFWSPIRFVINFGDLLGVKVEPNVLLSLIVNGIQKEKKESQNLPKEVFTFTPEKHVLEVDEKRELILANAESLFGTYGYQKTQIYDIAKASGIGVGTIYLYFENKKEILRELVRWINKGLRYNVRKAMENVKQYPRLVQEIAGLYAFVQFFKSHANMYKIVRESQSLDLEIAKDYYTSIFISYCKALENSVNDGKLQLNSEKFGTIDTKNILQYIAMLLMGIGHYLGERYILAGKVSDTKKLERFLEDIYVYLSEGLGVAM
jgi:AcrR family transcriptional regulator